MTDATQPRHRSAWVKLAGGLAILLVALTLLLIFFPWDVLRGPLNRYVSEKTGRQFEITRKLDVKLGLTTRILADGIEFANPDWARDKFLIKAESAEIDIRLLPLLKSRIELPLISLRKPQLGLQMEADGRRSWALGRDSSDKRNIPDIGALVVDEGSAHFIAMHEGADIQTDFSVRRGWSLTSTTSTTAATSTATAKAAPEAAGTLPLSFKSKGTWKKEAFTAEGQTGNVLYLSAPLQQPFPAWINATAGRTTLRADGFIASLATLDGTDASFQLQGANLAELYKLVGVVLPETPRYSVRGRVKKQGAVWQVRQIGGQLGHSDIAGELAFDQSEKVPLLSGQVQSKALDFDDLAPLIGLPEQPRSAGVARVAAGTSQIRREAPPQAPRAPGARVLPTAALDLARVKAMNADIRYVASRITNVKQLPLERMSVHVLLKDGLLQLNSLDLGVAGGQLAGRMRIDGNSNPALTEIKLDARALELSKLFPGFKLTQASFGKLHGEIDLKGRGNSVAQMLGSSSGNVALLMGKGQISNLLMEFAGLDGAEIIKFFVRGDENIQLRCVATAFEVNRGLMTTRAFVVDTSDTVIYGAGTVSLTDESIDLILRPAPKDASILSLRSTLKVSGTFGTPKAGVDKGALAGRAGLALALGAINPLLALAATIETGPGKDADCAAALRDASAPGAAARIAATAPPPSSGVENTVGNSAGRTAQPQPSSKPAPQSSPHYPLDKPATR